MVVSTSVITSGSTSGEAEPSRPPNSLRVEHAARTRRRILDASVRLVTDRGDADFSMRDVAAASGVSLRTVHRYYPSRQDLIDAVATVGDQATASNLPTAAFDLAELHAWLRDAWRNLLEQEAFIRAQHTSPNGAAIRRARIPFFREVTRTLLEREASVDPAALDDVVDTALLLTSSSAMFELIDVLELPLERAAKLASDAVLAVIEAHRG